MSKLITMDQKAPARSTTSSTTAFKTLEAEKASLLKRHEAIWALRDEDVENNIKIRGQLAKARRDLEAMTKLRDEDLVNVQAVRIKLADATRTIDRLQASGASGRSSPSRENRAGSRTSMFMERRDTTDLFAVAKAAALQERALELEKRNSDLLSQIQTLKGGANIDTLNSMTAHQAWKDKVADLEAKLKAKDAEVARATSSLASVRHPAASIPPAAPSGAGAGVEWHRVEAIHEEHAGYRERMGAKLQALRSEKEGLQRELHRKEDEVHGLESKVQSLQRRVGVM
jgi:DNA repair exonuclease SbcCD ATPase subunit